MRINVLDTFARPIQICLQVTSLRIENTISNRKSMLTSDKNKTLFTFFFLDHYYFQTEPLLLPQVTIISWICDPLKSYVWYSYFEGLNVASSLILLGIFIIRDFTKNTAATSMAMYKYDDTNLNFNLLPCELF